MKSRSTEIVRRILQGAVVPAVALGISLLIGSIIMVASGVSPLDGYGSILQGAFGSTTALGRTLQTATPLILTGIAVAFAFRGGLFNIGADGQFTAGALVAAWAGVAIVLPPPIGIVVILMLGALGGWAVGALAGFLKMRFHAHEVVVTIMLNFIVANIAVWMLLNSLSAGREVPGSHQIADGNRLARFSPQLAGLHWGIAVAVLAAVAASLYLWRSGRGLELRVSGLAPRASRFLGVSRLTTGVAALGGGGIFAGLAGAGEVMGTYGNMTVPFVTNLGFLGIGVALLGKNHPLGCIIGGTLLGALSAGGQQMQFDLGISAHLSEVLVGVILLFVTVNVLWKKRAVRQTAVLREEVPAHG